MLNDLVSGQPDNGCYQYTYCRVYPFFSGCKAQGRRFVQQGVRKGVAVQCLMFVAQCHELFKVVSIGDHLAARRELVNEPRGSLLQCPVDIDTKHARILLAAEIKGAIPRDVPDDRNGCPLHQCGILLRCSPTLYVFRYCPSFRIAVPCGLSGFFSQKVPGSVVAAKLCSCHAPVSSLYRILSWSLKRFGTALLLLIPMIFSSNGM